MEPSIDALKSTAKKAILITESTLDTASRTTSSLSALRQKLALEKISLEATVVNLVASTKDTEARLESVLGDIHGLQDEVHQLRAKLDRMKSEELDVKERYTAAQMEKQNLVRAVEDLLKDLSVASMESQANAEEVEGFIFILYILELSCYNLLAG